MWPTNLPARGGPGASCGKRTPGSAGPLRLPPTCTRALHRGCAGPTGRNPFLPNPGPSLRVLSAPLLPTDPAQGGSLHPVYPKVTPWASLYSGQIDSLPVSPLAQVQRAIGSLRLRFRWSGGSVDSSCSENATANWNHVVRIKSRSPSFLSLIRAHCLSAPK